MTDSLVMWVVYDHPTDFPDGFIARRWDGATPTNVVITANTAGAVRTQLRHVAPDLVCFKRAENDDPKIVEVWL